MAELNDKETSLPASDDGQGKEQFSYKEYAFRYDGKSLNFWICVLLSVITAIISVLSTGGLTSEDTATVFIVFLGILIVMYAVYVYGLWGVLMAALSTLLFCVLKNNALVESAINVLANTLQAFIIWLVLRFTLIDDTITEKSGVITDYKLILAALGVIYIACSIFLDRNIVLYVFAGLVVLLAVVFSVAERKATNILYLVFFALLPSLTGGVSNSLTGIINGVGFEVWFNSAFIWAASNTVLFGTFGYLLISMCGGLKRNSYKIKKPVAAGGVMIKLSTLMFYIATLVWNLIFYFMYLVGWLEHNTATYIFPWAVGNIFFVVNLLFTMNEEYDKSSAIDPFKWFENRAVVAESNTDKIMTIIAFLLPLSANYLGAISHSIIFIFVLNITCAVLSIGLVWVPFKKIAFMEFIKNFKTLFHLYTISLLLLNAVMIINGV